MNTTARTHNLSKRLEMLRFIKYCMVGALNTMLTLGVIFVCKSMLGINPYVSNAAGYIVGVLNSFLWNKKWVFRSHGGICREAIRFLIGFAVCYLLQFLTVWSLNQSSFGDIELSLSVFTLSGYGIATLIGNVVYTVANFIYNRMITFKSDDKV